MNKRFWGLFVNLILITSVSAQTTLEQCQRDAAANYPLIKKYDLVNRSTGLTISNINKEWLPQISATVQASLQSRVATLPEELNTMLAKQGRQFEGLDKDQYRIGVDINQTVFDGGRNKNQKEIAHRQGDVEIAQNDVDRYKVYTRINELYFGALLIEENISLNNDLQQLLASNEKKLTAMVKNGIASCGDLYSVQAERLSAVQQATELYTQKSSFLHILSIFCGHGIDSIVKPTLPSSVIETINNRPELRLVDSQLRLAEAQSKLVDANLRPKLSVFAQGFYGYPGYDMFHDMINRSFSLNGMIGARLTWNIGSLYTHKNDRAKLQLQQDLFNNQRDLFLFNNNLDQIHQREDIDRYRKLMNDDEKIIDLRTKVRIAAESRLTHGVIDINDLIKEINTENKAKILFATHEIDMLKQMYDYKYTLNQ